MRFGPDDGDVYNLPIIELLHEFAIAGFFVLGGIAPTLDHPPQDNAYRKQGYPQNHRLECRIHL
jgi:hypothetical protein